MLTADEVLQDLAHSLRFDPARMYDPVTKALLNLEKLGIVRESTGGRRNKLYAYDAYLKILEEGAEPLRHLLHDKHRRRALLWRF